MKVLEEIWDVFFVNYLIFGLGLIELGNWVYFENGRIINVVSEFFELCCFYGNKYRILFMFFCIWYFLWKGDVGIR